MRILCNRLTEIEHGRQRVMFHNTYRWNVRGLSPTTSEKCTYTDRGVVASSCLGKQPIRAQDQHSLRVGMMSFEKKILAGGNCILTKVIRIVKCLSLNMVLV